MSDTRLLTEATFGLYYNFARYTLDTRFPEGDYSLITKKSRPTLGGTLTKYIVAVGNAIV